MQKTDECFNPGSDSSPLDFFSGLFSAFLCSLNSSFVFACSVLPLLTNGFSFLSLFSVAFPFAFQELFSFATPLFFSFQSLPLSFFFFNKLKESCFYNKLKGSYFWRPCSRKSRKSGKSWGYGLILIGELQPSLHHHLPLFHVGIFLHFGVVFLTL